MSQNKGYILLHRSLQDCWIWFDDPKFTKGQAWVDLLMMVNHADKRLQFNGEFITVEEGQVITSIRSLAERWGWSKDSVKRFLNLLERDMMITQNCDTHRTLVTIVNYGVYQVPEKKSATRLRHQSDKNETQIGQKSEQTINEIHEIKRKDISNDISQRKDESDFEYSENPDLETAFKDFVSMRNKIKKPLTANALTRLKSKLNKLSHGDVSLAVAILNQSVDHCWQDIYELKSEEEQPQKSTPVGITEYQLMDYNIHPQVPPYFGFPAAWFDNGELVKDRLTTIRQPQNLSVGVTDETIYTPDDLWKEFELRKRGYEHEQF